MTDGGRLQTSFFRLQPRAALLMWYQPEAGPLQAKNVETRGGPYCNIHKCGQISREVGKMWDPSCNSQFLLPMIPPLLSKSKYGVSEIFGHVKGDGGPGADWWCLALLEPPLLKIPEVMSRISTGKSAAGCTFKNLPERRIDLISSWQCFSGRNNEQEETILLSYKATRTEASIPSPQKP